MILYDYAIHWFDLISTLLGKQAKRVYASVQYSQSQKAKPPLLAHAALDYDDCLVTLAINGDSLQGSDMTRLVASKATVVSEGPGLNQQKLSIITPSGTYTPTLIGAWFDDGFHGAMAELLCAIEQKREPSHSAHDNLRSLELCFAALASADQGQVKLPQA